MGLKARPYPSMARIGAQTASSADNMVNNSLELDRAYILRELDTRPSIRGTIATMIRDGEIDRAVMRSQYKYVTERLGKPLSIKCKKLRHVRAGMWRELFRIMVGQEEGQFEPDDTEPLTDQMVRDFCLFGLGKGLDTPLPTKHVASSFEGPLFLVLLAEAKERKDRLQYVSFANHSSFGWVEYDQEKTPCKVTVGRNAGGEVYELTLRESEARMRGMTVVISSNLFLDDVQMKDEEEGWSQSIIRLLMKQHPNHTLTQNDDAFDHPSAADVFTDMDLKNVPKEIFGGNTCAAKSTAASSSSGSVAALLVSPVKPKEPEEMLQALIKPSPPPKKKTKTT
jgi:hypothetical protein